MAHAFVEDIESPCLAATDRHHLGRVLRVRAGDEITVSDGRGGLRVCMFGERLEPVGAVVRLPRPEPAITIGFALVKGDRPEWIVQKLTELGVDRIVPFRAARSVVRWDGERASRHHERLALIAREAAMQSRRCWLPEVEPVTTFAELAARPGAARADPGGAPPTLAWPVVLVGPEGGWDEAELAAGLPPVTLSDGVLRSDTAAVVAGAVLTVLRSGLATPRGTQRG